MRRNNDRTAKIAWWHLGASGLLQPLSEDFLYRSPTRPQPGSFRCHGMPCRKERRHED